ncbi:hypothetical protein [Streptomyces sp. NPDC004250]|uniref:hypothetical protein n=1 Tax=Streptomyces sp. NPDC004250 TaxID=3364692 RepID=UPI0036CD6779
MAFPQDPLGLRAEMRTGTVWTDFTKDVYTRDPITHARGVRNEGAVADPAAVPLLINNRSGKYSPRNPLSPYYGLIGRNTPVRLSLPGEETYLQLDGDPATYASTPDHASLDITGDLDVRWEGEADWYLAGAQMLIGKWTETAGERSFHMRLEGGQLRAYVTRDGTAGPTTFWPLPALPRRAALRWTMDADNGAGGVTFHGYWAESLAGPWTSLGEVTLANPVTAYTGPAPLVIAPSQLSGIASGILRYPMAGRVYRAEVRSGINGTIVASPDFEAQAAGTANFVDGAGRTWTLAGAAELRDRVDRFVGEISEWPQRWAPSEKDVWVPVQAAGVLRRLGRGTKALDSALRRRIPSYGPLAYWPLEEGSEATQGYSPIAGVKPLTAKGLEWGKNDSLPSSGPLPEVVSTGAPLPTLRGTVPPPASALTAWSVYFMYRLDQPNSTQRTFMRVQCTGTVAEWRIVMSGSGSRIQALDSEGAFLVNNLISTGTDIFGKWVQLRFYVQQSGGDIEWRVDWADVGGDRGGFGTTVAGTIGRPTAVGAPTEGYTTDLNGLSLGHISVWPVATTAAYDRAMDAWTGEAAGARMVRLSAEEGLPLAVSSLPSATELVGSQGRAPVLDLIRAAADADGGMLTEDQTSLRLLYRPRQTLYSQAPALVLDYAAGEIAPPLEPVDDDTDIRNDVTVQRDGGSSARAVLESGPLSVQAPPDGVGVYDDSTTLSLASDEQAEPQAYWRLHLGTWDEPRYPAVTLLLHKHPELIPAVLALREGDVIRLTGMPKWLAPDDVDLMYRGLNETLLPRKWVVTFDCVPAGPWQVGVLGDSVRGRVDVDEGGSTLVLPATAEATQLVVHTPAPGPAGALPWISSAGPAPTYPAEFPFDVRFGGETARATACVPVAYDAFGRTVSNGWGIADCGFSWVGALGADSDRSVASGIASITLASAKDTARFQRVVSQITDCEVLTRISVSAVATGSAIIPSVLLRYTGNDTFYRARVRFDLSEAMAAEVTRAYAQVGSSTTLPYTYTAGAWFWVRARLTGHRVQVRVWPEAQLEPAVWHADQTIASDTIPVGEVGVTASTFGGNTNTNPVVRYDDFRVITPQLMTVERSLNGIVKPHSVGTSLSLANPARLAL